MSPLGRWYMHSPQWIAVHLSWGGEGPRDIGRAPAPPISALLLPPPPFSSLIKSAQEEQGWGKSLHAALCSAPHKGGKFKSKLPRGEQGIPSQASASRAELAPTCKSNRVHFQKWVDPCPPWSHLTSLQEEALANPHDPSIEIDEAVPLSHLGSLLFPFKRS